MKKRLKHKYSRKELRRFRKMDKGSPSLWTWLFTNLWGEKVSTLALIGNVAFVLLLFLIMLGGF